MDNILKIGGNQDMICVSQYDLCQPGEGGKSSGVIIQNGRRQ